MASTGPKGSRRIPPLAEPAATHSPPAAGSSAAPPRPACPPRCRPAAGAGSAPQPARCRQRRGNSEARLLAPHERHGQGYYDPEGREARQEVAQDAEPRRDSQSLRSVEEEPGPEVAEPTGHQTVHDPQDLA